jgi:hypothetical protein
VVADLRLHRTCRILAILSGPLLGVILLLLTSQSLTFINLAGSIVYALTVPMAAIALTLYWFDLQIRSWAVVLNRGLTCSQQIGRAGIACAAKPPFWSDQTDLDQVQAECLDLLEDAE